HVPGLLTLKDAEGRYLLVNSDFKDWFALADGDIRGRTDRDLFPGRSINAAIETYERRALDTLSTAYHEVEVPGAGGRAMTALVSSFPVVGADGVLIGIGSVALDLTERRRTEEALRRSEASYRSLIEDSRLGIFLHRDGAVVHA